VCDVDLAASSSSLVSHSCILLCLCVCVRACVRVSYQTDEQFILNCLQMTKPWARFLLFPFHLAFHISEKLMGRNPHMLNPAARQHVSSFLQRIDQCLCVAHLTCMYCVSFHGQESVHAFDALLERLYKETMYHPKSVPQFTMQTFTPSLTKNVRARVCVCAMDRCSGC